MDTPALLARVENILRTTGHAETADALAGAGEALARPRTLVDALRAQAANLRNERLPATASALEAYADQLARAQTVTGALRVALEAAKRGAWW